MSIWAAVDRLVDQATDEAGLLAHGLDLWAAQRWYEAGRDVPPYFLAHERAAVMATLSVPSQLAWIRDLLDGPIVLLKGPEVAARYPDPALRPFGDLDLLVANADEAQQRLIAAGCIEISEKRPHHFPTLQCPGSLLSIEIHERPNGPDWATIPTEELFATAVPSTLAVDGIMTVSPAQHAVLLAAHSWHHEPFRRLIDLLDIAAMSQDSTSDELDDLAKRWGLSRIWKITNCAIDAISAGEPPRASVCRFLGSHLWEARERSPVEIGIALHAIPFWAPFTPQGMRHMMKQFLPYQLHMAQKGFRYMRRRSSGQHASPAQLELSGWNS